MTQPSSDLNMWNFPESDVKRSQDEEIALRERLSAEAASKAVSYMNPETPVYNQAVQEQYVEMPALIKQLDDIIGLIQATRSEQVKSKLRFAHEVLKKAEAQIGHLFNISINEKDVNTELARREGLVAEPLDFINVPKNEKWLMYENDGEIFLERYRNNEANFFLSVHYQKNPKNPNQMIKSGMQPGLEIEFDTVGIEELQNLIKWAERYYLYAVNRPDKSIGDNAEPAQ